VLYASVNGTPDATPLLQLDGRDVSVSKDGWVTWYSRHHRNLTSAAATASTRIQHQASRGGTELGTVHLVARERPHYTGKVAEISRLTGSSTSLDLNPRRGRTHHLGITPG